MLVRITRLRQAGARCADLRVAQRMEGRLVMRDAGRTGLVRKLTLHGPKHGAFDGPVLGAIYEPQLIHISSETFVLRGYERGEGGGRAVGYVQEWMIEFSWPTHVGPPRGEV